MHELIFYRFMDTLGLLSRSIDGLQSLMKSTLPSLSNQSENKVGCPLLRALPPLTLHSSQSEFYVAQTSSLTRTQHSRLLSKNLFSLLRTI